MQIDAVEYSAKLTSICGAAKIGFQAESRFLSISHWATCLWLAGYRVALDTSGVSRVILLTSGLEGVVE